MDAERESSFERTTWPVRPMRRWLVSLWSSWIPNRTVGILFMLGILPILFFQTSVHELSHCALAAITGAGCVRVAPFPSRVDDFVAWGATTMVEPPGPAPIAAPEVIAFLLIVVLRAIVPRIGDRRLSLLTRVWLFGAIVDFYAHAFQGSVGQSDQAAVAKVLGWSRSQMTIAMAPASLAALIVLLVPIGGSSERLRERPWPRRDLVAVGATYGLVSLIAVITSLSIGWSDIGRQPQLYWLAVALQVATIGWTTWFVARKR